MLKNEKEYLIAKAELARFEEAYSDFDIVEEIGAGVDPVIAASQRSSFVRKIDQLHQEIRDYENLISGTSTKVPVSGLDALGNALIAARLSKGISQKALGEICGLKEQQIQRYEKDSYSSANIKRLSLIARSLGVAFDGYMSSAHLNNNVENPLRGLDVENFPFSAMKIRGWFGEKIQKQHRLSVDEKRAVLVRFLRLPAVSLNVLHRKTVSQGSKDRSAALLVWQARVLKKASLVADQYPRYSPFDREVLGSIAQLSSDPRRYC